MPTYEPRREHIRAAVASVLTQSYADWTLEIRDDVSKRENVQDHVASFLSDPRISFVRNEKNQGIGGNWNACVRSAEAKYVAFLFQDDLWGPEYLKRSIAALEAFPSAGFTSVNHSYLMEGEIQTSPLYAALEEEKRKILREGLHGREFLHWWLARGCTPNLIGEPSFVVLRRSLMETVGLFNESMVQYLDSEYWLRCLLHAEWYYITEPLGSFRVHPSGMSATNEQLGRGIFERFAALSSTVEALPATERRQGNEAIVRALSSMIRKFFSRLQRGSGVNGKGASVVKRFCQRHPILTLRALIAAMHKNSTSS